MAANPAACTVSSVVLGRLFAVTLNSLVGVDRWTLSVRNTDSALLQKIRYDSRPPVEQFTAMAPANPFLLVLDSTVTIGGNPYTTSIVVTSVRAPGVQPILIVGDSNASGSNGDSQVGMVGSWRFGLYQYLRARRSDFDFVGSLMTPCESSDACSLWFHETAGGQRMVDVLNNLPAHMASAGVGQPMLVIDNVGNGDIQADGASFAALQARRNALTLLYQQLWPAAKILLLDPTPYVPGTGGFTGFNAMVQQYNTWLGAIHVPAAGPNVSYLQINSSIGSGEMQTDGAHYNRIAIGRIVSYLGPVVDSLLGPWADATPPSPRAFRKRTPDQSVQCQGIASLDGAQIASHAGMNPGTGSAIYTCDYYPTVLDAAALHTVMGYGDGTWPTTWYLFQQGPMLRLYWTDSGGTIFGGSTPASSGMSDNALTANRWHRIVIMADASTGTIGLYVNGALAGLVQGHAGWSFAQKTFFVASDNVGRIGAPGFYGRVGCFKGAAIPRPGSMAALRAVEDDYYGEASMVGVSAGGVGCGGYFSLGGILIDSTWNNGGSNPAAALSGTAAFVPAYPATPLRPWEYGGPPDVGGISLLVAVAGANTVTASPGPDRILEITGALASPATVALPKNPGQCWTVLQNTTGAQAVTVAGVVVAAAKRMTGYIDTAGVFQRVTADT